MQVIQGPGALIFIKEGMSMELLISFVPIIVIIVLIAGFKVRGDITGVIGWILMLAVAALFFHTSIEIGLLASVKGALASLSITGMGFFALLQITFMQHTGALERIVVTIKTFSHDDRACQIMVVNVVFGTMLVCVGATPAIILPPIMFAMGYTTVIAIALPCIGYDSLCTFAMLGATVVTLTDILVGSGFTINGAEPTVPQVAQYFSHYLPVITPCICFAMLFMAGGFKLFKEGWLAALITGVCMGGSAWLLNMYAPFTVTLLGVCSGAITLCVMLVYMKIRGVRFFNHDVLDEEDKKIEASMPFWKALSPWALLIFFCVITNFVLPLKDFLYSGPLEMRVKLWANDAGQPIRLFWQAYFWVLISTIIATAIIKPKKGTWGAVLKDWNHRWAPPTISSFVYFMIAYVMMYSGYAVGADGTWALVNEDWSIPALWAHSAADLFGWWYPVANGFLGLLGGFITGSEASTGALFATYNIISSQDLGLNAIAVIASGGIAAGLASVITPVKLQQSAASLNKIGVEGEVLRHVIPYAIVLVCISVVMSQIFAVTIPVNG